MILHRTNNATIEVSEAVREFDIDQCEHLPVLELMHDGNKHYMLNSYHHQMMKELKHSKYSTKNRKAIFRIPSNSQYILIQILMDFSRLMYL